MSGFADFRRIVWSALFAGIFTGVLITLVQHVTTIPLIAAAETYEHGAPAPHEGIAADTHAVEDAAHDHAAHGHSAWAPAEGFERAFYTGLTTTLAGIGYALLIAATLALTRSTGPRAGLIVGVIGLAVFQLAPALGLPPEPPGVPAAPLFARQAWWIGTACSTALAFFCWFRFKTHRQRVLIPIGIALAVLPHLIGAPHAPGHDAAVPPELVRRFAVMALLTAALFWISLGASTGFFWRRFDPSRMQR